MMSELDENAVEAGLDKAQLASRLSAFSLASGLVLCCPLAGLAAVCSGALALFIGRGTMGDRAWRRFAWGGVVLGVVGLVLGVFGAILLEQVGARWEREGRVLFSGPNNALFALYNDDSDGFLMEFTGEGAQASPEALADLRSLIEARCGTFISCKAPDVITIDGSGPWTLEGYDATFASSAAGDENTVYPCRIRVERLPSGTLRLVWMEIQVEPVMIRYPSEAQEARQGG